MSSDDFFNQSFTPPSTKAKPPPPPPPPPHLASSSTTSSTLRSRNSRNGLSTSTSSTTRPSSSAVRSSSSLSNINRGVAGRTSGSSGSAGATTGVRKPNAGYYATNNASTSSAVRKATRPTGNYYATTDTTPAPAPSFHAYGGGSGGNRGGVNSVGTAGGYNNGGNDSDGMKQDVQQDWFSTSNSDTNSNSYNNTAYNDADTTVNHDPYMNPSTSTSSMNSIDKNQFQQQQQQQQQQQKQQPEFQQSQHNPNNFFSGSMDSNANPALSGPMMMQPSTSSSTINAQSNNNTTNNSSSFQTYTYNPDDFADEPPLLEELGINISHIQTKSLAVILPVKYAKSAIDANLMEDSDMAGPIAFAILLAIELLLAGKINFGYIYGFGLFGVLATTLIVNLMTPSNAISIWTVVSILGYSLLPVNFLAALNVFYRIKFMGDIGVVLGMVTIGWCAVSSTRLFEKGCEMRDQRYLIGYPNVLLYSAFVLLTIF